MRTKLALLSILLVVVPTAILSLLAARSLEHWELTLQKGLQRQAESLAETVVDRSAMQIRDALEQLRLLVFDCLSRGDDIESMSTAFRGLQESRGIVGRVYVFMNPLGFLYPASGAPSRGAVDLDPQELLLAALRQEVSTAGQFVPMLSVTVDQRPYVFAALNKTSPLFVGFEVDRRHFEKRLAGLLESPPEGEFRLKAEGPGLWLGPASVAGMDADKGGVTVGDTFGDAASVNAEQAEVLLTSRRLAPPFDSIVLSVLEKDPNAMMRTGRARYRLYACGILVLACGILVGAWFVLREAAVEIREARRRSDFVAGVSHDLRTPVASMRMLAESLLLGHVADADRQKQFLGIIVRECERLSQLVEKVLYFVKLDQRSLVYYPSTVDVARVAAAAVETFRARIGSVQLRQSGGERVPEPEVGFSTENGVEACVDENALSQAILNLLDNARKYGRPKPAHPAVVSAEVQDPSIGVSVNSVVRRKRAWTRTRAWVRISVKDHGPGVEPSQQKKIFRRFYRAPDAAVREASGFGLGLALCRHVAEQHGGWIEVASVPGQGSTFSIYLPRETMNQADGV